MLLFIARRCSLAFLIIIMATASLYVLVHAAPGDPLSVMLGPRATPALKESMRERLGLDQPMIIQMAKYVGNVLQGDLGNDIRAKKPVIDAVMHHLPHSLYLISASLLLAAGLGIPLGCFAAVYRGSVADHIIGLLSVSVIAVPALIIAIYGMLFFSVKLRWLPAIGLGEKGNFADYIYHLILPAISVGIGWVGYLARLVRASMLEILDENYIRNARSFGISERLIIFRYALRIAVAPTVTVLGIGVGYMIGSIVFAEIIFARPGIGKMMYEAVNLRNYPMIMGAIVASTILMVISVMISDIINALIDPRVREGQE